MLKNRVEIVNLQILRFIAAAMVLFYHLQHQVETRGSGGFAPFNPIYWGGGVDIFFVVSGFIMYHLSAGQFGKLGYPGKFLKRRLARIVPPYWLFTGLMLSAILLPSLTKEARPDVYRIVASFSFVPYPDANGNAYPVLILGWTLNFEMFFYLSFFAAIHFPKRVGMALLFGAFISAALMRATVFSSAQPSTILIWADPIIVEFLFGILLAMIYETGFRWGSRLVGYWFFAASFVAMAYLKHIGMTEQNWLARPAWMGLPALVACAGLVLNKEPSKRSPVAMAMAFGGDASYAIYLSHPISLGVIRFLGHRAIIIMPWFYIITAAVAAIAAGIGVYLFVEKPLTKLARRVTDCDWHGERHGSQTDYRHNIGNGGPYSSAAAAVRAVLEMVRRHA